MTNVTNRRSTKRIPSEFSLSHWAPLACRLCQTQTGSSHFMLSNFSRVIWTLVSKSKIGPDRQLAIMGGCAISMVKVGSKWGQRMSKGWGTCDILWHLVTSCDILWLVTLNRRRNAPNSEMDSEPQVHSGSSYLVVNQGPHAIIRLHLG